MRRSQLAAAAPRQARREVELSLLIAADDPERTFQKLGRIREIGPYRLRPTGAERILDRYFDTPSGDLSKRGVALRLRTVNGKTFIGLKGPQRSRSTQTEDRFEHERPFSRNAVKEVAKQVDLRHRDGSVAATGASPDIALEDALGVCLVQTRKTDRLTREIRDSREVHGPVLAELALDRVRFHINGQVMHYEIEAEAKRTGRGTSAAREVPRELLSRYPNELEGWPHGKLATGKAIEELLRTSSLPGLTPDGLLTREAYKAIARHLNRRPR